MPRREDPEAAARSVEATGATRRSPRRPMPGSAQATRSASVACDRMGTRAVLAMRVA